MNVTYGSKSYFSFVIAILNRFGDLSHTQDSRKWLNIAL